MKVKFLTSMAGLRVSYQPGQIEEIEKDEALRLIKAGFAEPVAEPKAQSRRTAVSRKPGKSEKR